MPTSIYAICALQEDDAQALKDSYAKAQQVAKDKAAEFDRVRDAARALNKELNDKARLLKEQEAEVARLAVSCLMLQPPRHFAICFVNDRKTFIYWKHFCSTSMNAPKMM